MLGTGVFEKQLVFWLRLINLYLILVCFCRISVAAREENSNRIGCIGTLSPATKQPRLIQPIVVSQLRLSDMWLLSLLWGSNLTGLDTSTQKGGSCTNGNEVSMLAIWKCCGKEEKEVCFPGKGMWS